MNLRLKQLGFVDQPSASGRNSTLPRTFIVKQKASPVCVNKGQVLSQSVRARSAELSLCTKSPVSMTREGRELVAVLVLSCRTVLLPRPLSISPGVREQTCHELPDTAIDHGAGGSLVSFPGSALAFIPSTPREEICWSSHGGRWQQRQLVDRQALCPPPTQARQISAGSRRWAVIDHEDDRMSGARELECTGESSYGEEHEQRAKQDRATRGGRRRRGGGGGGREGGGPGELVRVVRSAARQSAAPFMLTLSLQSPTLASGLSTVGFWNEAAAGQRAQGTFVPDVSPPPDLFLLGHLPYILWPHPAISD